MIPSWTISALTAIPSLLVVLGDTCLVLMAAILAAGGVYLAVRRWPA